MCPNVGDISQIKPVVVAPKIKVEELSRKWKTFQNFEEDPLKSWCFNSDFENKEFTWNDYWLLAQRQDPKELTRLLLESWKWRADTRSNIVCSVEGEQSSGKSLSSIYFCRTLGIIFDRPFSFSTDIAFYPEEMEDLISKSQNRQTILCDEQQQTNVGIMSSTIKSKLGDMEDQLRFSQTNLFFAAPQLRVHTHYFSLKAIKPVRLRNKLCNQCRKPNCIGCEVPEEKRSGYPAFFVLMLNTKRAQDEMLVPRGYVLAKMPPKKIADEYEQIKQQHILRLKAKESRRWEILKKLAEEVWERGKSQILKQTKTGKWFVAPKKTIEIIFYNAHGMGYLTNEGLELLLTLVSEKAREHIIREGMNEEIEKEGEGVLTNGASA